MWALNCEIVEKYPLAWRRLVTSVKFGSEKGLSIATQRRILGRMVAISALAISFAPSPEAVHPAVEEFVEGG